MEEGLRQVLMALINWATHVLQWFSQSVAIMKSWSESHKNYLSSDY